MSEHNPLEKGYSIHDTRKDPTYEKGFLKWAFSQIEHDKKKSIWEGYKAIFRIEWKTKEKEGVKSHRLEGFARRAANLWLISRH